MHVLKSSLASLDMQHMLINTDCVHYMELELTEAFYTNVSYIRLGVYFEDTCKSILALIAILSVIICHWASNPYPMTGPIGQVGVTLFFVLSGYNTTGSIMRAQVSGWILIHGRSSKKMLKLHRR